ncbi:LysE family translocator [Pelagibius sp.]|uniref:LysE family translocator n=1 Tax=Pelagibius sp. TaxID=1931238 RepID=UPI002623CAAC|nr:LysE family translocator [Pelagibius sp.]
MTTVLAHLPDLMLAYLAYLVATVSPGPANVAVMAHAMRHGRLAGLQVAAGVLLGSLTWGVLAALGLSAFLFSYAELLSVVRLLGGLYLLWLAYRSLRAALGPTTLLQVGNGRDRSAARCFGLGLAIHLTNPKSIFAWLAIIAIGVGPGAPAWVSFLVVGGCWLMGIVLYAGYALTFSTSRMIALYGTFRRWIEGMTAGLFGFAGVKLLMSSDQ